MNLPIRPVLVYAVLVVAAMGVMLPALFGPFIFDDQPLIFGNHYVHSFEHWPRWIKGGLWDSNYDPTEGVARRGYWRPMILASYAWDWALGGGSPFVFHVTNVVIHAANVVLLFRVLRRWCGSDWGALVGALFFAVHPVQTEPVAWIAGRTDSLCVLGMLTAVVGVRCVGAGKRIGGWLLQLGGVVLALGSKEAAITLPALAVVEYWARDAKPLTFGELWRLLVRVVPFVVMALMLLVIRHFTVVDIEQGEGLSAANRAPLVFEALGRYVWLVIWPADTTLGQALLFYDKQRHFVVRWEFVTLGAVALIGALGFVWRNRLTRPSSAMATLLTCGLVFPVSGVVWLGYGVLVSPRFLYVPMLGVALIVGLVVRQLSERGLGRRALVVTLGVVSVLAVVTFDRAADYSSEQAFWKAEIEQSPNYTPAQEYFIVRELREQRTRTALRLAQHFFTLNQAAGFPDWYSGNLVTRIVEGLLQLTPDVQRTTLANVERFCTNLAHGRADALVVPEAGVSFAVAADASFLSVLKARRRLLLLLAAEAASRLGEDATALNHVRQVTDGCERCWTILNTSAIIQARSGDLEGAKRVVNVAAEVAPPGSAAALLETLETVTPFYAALPSGRGPLVSRYYASLGAFGRAFAAAEEAVTHPPPDAASRLAIAELAVRAGQVDVARRLTTFDDEEWRRWVTELDPPIRWLDVEPGPEVWVPEVTAL